MLSLTQATKPNLNHWNSHSPDSQTVNTGVSNMCPQLCPLVLLCLCCCWEIARYVTSQFKYKVSVKVPKYTCVLLRKFTALQLKKTLTVRQNMSKLRTNLHEQIIKLGTLVLQMLTTVTRTGTDDESWKCFVYLYVFVLFCFCRSYSDLSWSLQLSSFLSKYNIIMTTTTICQEQNDLRTVSSLKILTYEYFQCSISTLTSLKYMKWAKTF